MPSVLVVFCIFGLVGGAIFCIGETGLVVWDSGEIEDKFESWDLDIDGGDGVDAASAFECFCGEVGAVCEVEDCLGIIGGKANGGCAGKLVLCLRGGSAR